MHLSWKYKNVQKIKTLFPKAKMVFFGIGSCVYLSDINTNILRGQKDINYLRDLFLDTIVIVRDYLASDYLTNANIPHKYLPCPSYFCLNEFPEPENNLVNTLIFYEPKDGISKCYFTDQIHKDFIKLQKDFYDEYKAQAYCVSPFELNCAKSYGIDNIKLIKNRDETIEVIKKADIILSGRVHVSVPAFVAGKAIGLIPVDSRYLTLDDFGGQICKNSDDFKKLEAKKRDFEHYRLAYNFWSKT
jgi:hypothetical protein